MQLNQLTHLNLNPGQDLYLAPGAKHLLVKAAPSAFGRRCLGWVQAVFGASRLENWGWLPVRHPGKIARALGLGLERAHGVVLGDCNTPWAGRKALQDRVVHALAAQARASAQAQGPVLRPRAAPAAEIEQAVRLAARDLQACELSEQPDGWSLRERAFLVRRHEARGQAFGHERAGAYLRRAQPVQQAFDTMLDGPRGSAALALGDLRQALADVPGPAWDDDMLKDLAALALARRQATRGEPVQLLQTRLRSCLDEPTNEAVQARRMVHFLRRGVDGSAG